MRSKEIEHRVIRFSDQHFHSRPDHGGEGLVHAARARKGPVDVHCNFIDCVIVPPGSTIGLHSHTLDNEELYVVLRGTATMTLEHTVVQVGPGDTIINPPGGTHGLHNSGTEDVHLVVVEYPVVRDAQSADSKPRHTDHDPEHLA